MDSKAEIKPPSFDHSNEEIVFSDIAEINISDENVSFSFATKSRDGKNAKVSHVVYLTIPHFFRFTDVSYELKNNFIQEMIRKSDEIKKQQEEVNKKK